MPFFYAMSPMYWLFMIPGLLFSLWAQWKVQSAYGKYKQIANSRNLTGAQAARYLLDSSGLGDVRIEESQGMLSDHYDPGSRTLRLSPENYRVPSIAAVGIAAHEMGHALQHAENYGPLKLRSSIVPVANLGASFGPLIILAGLFLRMESLAIVGLVVFAMAFVFTLITLPVEFDASSRALRLMERNSLLTTTEMQGARSVLSAAAWTYVAAAVAALLQVLYYALIIFGGSRRRS